jgi:hypothetical protein
VLLSTQLLEMWEPFSQKARGVPFQVIRNEGRAEARLRTHKDMNVVFVRLHRQEPQALLLAALGNPSLGLLLHLSAENAAAILGYPHEMLAYRVVGISGFTHLQTVCVHATTVAHEHGENLSTESSVWSTGAALARRANGSGASLESLHGDPQSGAAFP